MEQRNLANKFAQLRLPRVLTGQGTQNTDRLLRFRPSGHNMDQLVQDFNTALDETAGSNSSSISTTSRRKVSIRNSECLDGVSHNFDARLGRGVASPPATCSMLGRT